jgi:hypothetical protein
VTPKRVEKSLDTARTSAYATRVDTPHVLALTRAGFWDNLIEA